MPTTSSSGEPGQAVLDIFNQLLNRIKQNKPLRSDNKPLNDSFVYQMLPLGQPINPDDYRDPWMPQGGGTIQAAQSNPPAPPAPAPAGAGAPASPAGAPPSPPPVSDEALRSMAAAYKTAVLATKLLRVTLDGSYEEFPTGQHLDFQYNGILMGMQAAAPNEADDPAVVAAVKAARKVLFKPNPDGTDSVDPTDAYQDYQDNTLAYGTAVAAFAQAYANAQASTAAYNAWPVMSRTYQNAVDLAKKKLVSEGGPAIEKALDTLASVGNPIQAHMIAQARQAYDAWNLGLAGAVPAAIPYSQISPSDWAKINTHGWQTFSSTQQSYQHLDTHNSSQSSDYSWLNKSSSTSGSGGVAFGFGVVGGSAGSSSSHHQDQGESQAIDYSHFSNSAKNLTITISYALIDIERPWLMSDLFYMDGWYLKGYQKGHISTGKAADQVDDGVNPRHALPMIPKQMLVIKNVDIFSADWGDDGAKLSAVYGHHQNTSDSSASNVAGSGGICLGPIAFGGSASHSSSTSTGQGSSFAAQDGSGYFGTTFNAGHLHIAGAQIIAWLSDIVPLCPPLDDPEFGKAAPAPAPDPAPAAAAAKS